MDAVFSSIKYSQSTEMINASFTLFVVTADGALGIEAKAFMRSLAEKIAGSLAQVEQ